LTKAPAAYSGPFAVASTIVSDTRPTSCSIETDAAGRQLRPRQGHRHDQDRPSASDICPSAHNRRSQERHRTIPRSARVRKHEVRQTGLTEDVVMPNYTALVTLLAVAWYFFLATRVAVARGTFGVKHPATTGNSEFERIFRVHMNTLEWMPTSLRHCGFAQSTSATKRRRCLAWDGSWGGPYTFSVIPRRWRSGYPAFSFS
jgi:MAPEG family